MQSYLVTFTGNKLVRLLPLSVECLPRVQLTTNLIKKAEEGVNGLMAKLGAPADLSQHSPHASVQQLLHATKSLTELNAGSALGHLQVQHQPRSTHARKQQGRHLKHVTPELPHGVWPSWSLQFPWCQDSACEHVTLEITPLSR